MENLFYLVPGMMILGLLFSIYYFLVVFPKKYM